MRFPAESRSILANGRFEILKNALPRPGASHQQFLNIPHRCINYLVIGLWPDTYDLEALYEN